MFDMGALAIAWPSSTKSRSTRRAPRSTASPVGLKGVVHRDVNIRKYGKNLQEL